MVQKERVGDRMRRSFGDHFRRRCWWRLSFQHGLLRINMYYLSRTQTHTHTHTHSHARTHAHTHTHTKGPEDRKRSAGESEKPLMWPARSSPIIGNGAHSTKCCTMHCRELRLVKNQKKWALMRKNDSGHNTRSTTPPHSNSNLQRWWVNHVVLHYQLPIFHGPPPSPLFRERPTSS
jgi:hypothetical protein